MLYFNTCRALAAPSHSQQYKREPSRTFKQACRYLVCPLASHLKKRWLAGLLRRMLLSS